MEKPPLILEIKGNSLDDGPGIRTVVFFKGCPLDCSWCHNPESKRSAPELSFEPDKCVGCETCLEVCPAGALDRDNPFFVDRARCNLCFKCAEACPSGALARVGRPIEIDAIVEACRRDKPFFDTSGGGVTLSGGEPTLPMEFSAALLERLKAASIHTLVETCGHFDYDRFEQLVLPCTDLVYFDLKLFDPVAHRTHCGRSNSTILANFTRLVKAGTCEILPRTPLIPGLTTGDDNLGAIASFLQQLGLSRAQLLPNNPLWPAKNTQLGLPQPPGALQQWLSHDQVRHCEDIFRSRGIDV